MKDHYVWLAWSSAFLVPWAALFAQFPQYRRMMWRTSLFTAPFGLTEPLFVPEYWNPPSLFHLAQTTGFYVESLILCFAIGGVGAVLYNGLTSQTVLPLDMQEREHSHHRWHRIAVIALLVVFPPLYFLPWNPIYAGIAAMVFGALAAIACRPDLTGKTLLGGALFLAYYTIFMLALKWSAPGYIERVWNLPAPSGLSLAGTPLEELLFGGSFGMYWSSVYEHLAWSRPARIAVSRVGKEGIP